MIINKYKAFWNKVETLGERPKYASKIIITNYDEFAKKVEKQELKYTKIMN